MDPHSDSQNKYSIQEKSLCAAHCFECSTLCLETIKRCLSKGSRFAKVELLTLLMDCAEISQAAFSVLTRNSDQYIIACNACAEVCYRCSQRCRQFSDKDLIECAEVCKSCADQCCFISAQ